MNHTVHGDIVEAFWALYNQRLGMWWRGDQDTTWSPIVTKSQRTGAQSLQVAQQQPGSSASQLCYSPPTRGAAAPFLTVTLTHSNNGPRWDTPSQAFSPHTRKILFLPLILCIPRPFKSILCFPSYFQCFYNKKKIATLRGEKNVYHNIEMFSPLLLLLA